MNNNITFKQVTARLDESNVSYFTIDLGNSWKIIISQYGGRILGPFKGDDGESLLWMSNAWHSKEEFAKLIGSRTWNIGGDRFWIEPELPFFAKDKKRFYDSYIVQDAIDPGNYSIWKNGSAVSLEQDVAAKTFELSTKDRNFRMRRTVRALTNPFSSKAAECGIDECFGIRQIVEIEDLNSSSPTYLETWLLSQINPRGELIVPFSGKSPEFLDYYEPIPEDMVRVENNKAFVTVTGDIRYKLGFKSLNTTGRSAYLGSFTDGNCYLFLRIFYNDPSSLYCGAPFCDPEVYGHPLFLYNDPGSQGGFAEFENCGMTIGADTGRMKSRDEVSYYFFVGNRKKLLALADEIL